MEGTQSGLQRRDLLRGGVALSGLAMPAAAQTEALRVLSSIALAVPLREIAAEFTRQALRQVEMSFGVAGVVAQRLRGGEAVDLVLNTAPLIRAFATEGLLEATGPAEVGRMEIGLAVREGAPSPDIASFEAWRAALLTAPSIALSDAASGATSAVHLRRVLEQANLAAPLASRLQTHPQGVDAVRAVAEGRAALVMTMISEIKAVSGVRLVGPLPPEVQLVTSFAAAVTARAKDPAGARGLLQLATGPFGAERFRAAGFTVAA